MPKVALGIGYKVFLDGVTKQLFLVAFIIFYKTFPSSYIPCDLHSFNDHPTDLYILCDLHSFKAHPTDLYILVHGVLGEDKAVGRVLHVVNIS